MARSVCVLTSSAPRRSGRALAARTHSKTMKLLFSSPSEPEVGLLKSVLDEAGIACEMRNENTHPNLPGAAFQPEIWIVNDEDYAEACEVRDAWHRTRPAETPEQVARGSESARGTALVCTFTGFLLLAAAVFLASQFAHVGDWRRFTGILTLFGLVGAVLLWTGLAQLRGWRKKG